MFADNEKATAATARGSANGAQAKCLLRAIRDARGIPPYASSLVASSSSLASDIAFLILP